MNSKIFSKQVSMVRILAICFVITGMIETSVFGEAFQLSVKTDPTVSGEGVGMTARFPNVGNMDGVDIDLIGTVISASNSRPNVFLREDDDFRFEMIEAGPGERRTVSVKWTFVKSGTNTAVTVEDVHIMLDDLDGSDDRMEGISTGDAYGYVIDFPSNVKVSESGTRISAGGSAEQVTGEPDGAITLYLFEKSSFLITYVASFSDAYSSNTSKFVHDGNKDFDYNNPTNPPVKPEKLFYSYHFNNPTGEFVRVDFGNLLPGSIKWDTTFKPVLRQSGETNEWWVPIMISLYQAWLDSEGYATTDSSLSLEQESGEIVVAASYSKGDRLVEIQNFDLPPGEYTLTLKTMPLKDNGKIANAATMKKLKGNQKTFTATASIDIE